MKNLEKFMQMSNIFPLLPNAEVKTRQIWKKLQETTSQDIYRNSN